MGKKTYQDYFKEIEELKKEFNLSAMECLALHLAASFKVNDMDYDKLKEELTTKPKVNEIECECGHDENTHYGLDSSASFIGMCAVVGCTCLEFKKKEAKG